jgi:hypothetical protein
MNEKIRSGDLTFIKAGAIITATLLGDSPHTQPVAVQFSGEAETASRILETLKEVVKQLGRCQLCIEESTTCEGFFCAECHRGHRLCDSCRTAGFQHWYQGFRPCSNCISTAKCVRLMPAMVSMDSGGAQLSAQISLSNGFGQVEPEAEVNEAHDAQLDQLSSILSTLVPVGEGPHNIKSFLCALRKPILVFYNGVWLVFLSMVAEMAHCGSVELSEKIHNILPPERLMLRDRQDPQNATYWTHPELLNLIPDDRMCATLLPCQAFNDHQKHLQTPALVAISGSDVIVVDQYNIYLAHPAAKTELRLIQATPQALTSICFAPVPNKNGKPNILMLTVDKKLAAFKITTKKHTPLNVPSTVPITKLIPADGWQKGTVLAISS